MTETDLLAALAAAHAPHPADTPGMTLAEIAMQVHGRDNSWTRGLVTRQVRQLLGDGRVARGQRTIETLNGYSKRIVVYRLLGKVNAPC